MPPSPPNDAPPSPPELQAVNAGRWALLLGVCLVYGGFGMVMASLAPVTGAIASDLGLSKTQIGMAQGAWALVYIAFAPATGAWLDRLHPAHALTMALMLVALSCGARALAQGPVSLALAVAIFGIGGPAISIGAPKLIGLCFASARERGLAIGIYSTAPLFGTAIALALTQSVVMPLVGGSWRACFVFYAAVVVALIGLWSAMHRVYFVYVPPSSTPHGATGRSRLLASKAAWPLLCIGAMTFVANNGLDTWMPALLRQRGLAAEEAGHWAAVPSLCGILAACIVPWLAHTYRRLALVIALLAACAMAMLVLAWAPMSVALAAMLPFGFARSAVVPILSLMIMQARHIEPRDMGAAMGMFFTIAQLGGLLGPPVLGMIADRTGDFRIALSFVALLCSAACLWAAFFLPRPRQAPVGS